MAADSGVNFVSTQQVEGAAQKAGLSADQTAEVVATYSNAQLGALRAGLAFLALFALLALAWVRRLPTSAAPPGDTGASPVTGM